MKNFDDLFREALADHAEVPPRRVWESLESRLNTPVAGAKPPATGWYWYAGIASVALVVGSIALNMGSKDDNITPVAAPVANNTATPIAPEAPATEVPATDNGQKKVVTFRTKTTANVATATPEDKDKVSPYGNAAAVGTKLHSYDDFDERAVASTQKHTTTDEAAMNGYKVNKIRKHRLVAAEMVPVGASAPTLAAAMPTEAPKTTQPAKTIATSTNPRQTKPGVAPLKPVTPAVKPPVAEPPVAKNEPAPDNNTASSAVQPTPDVATRPASLAVTTASKPASSGSAVAAAKPKPSGMVAQSKPYSTGGSSEPTHVADSGSAQPAAQAASSGSTSGKKKGFWNMFRSKKSNTN